MVQDHKVMSSCPECVTQTSSTAHASVTAPIERLFDTEGFPRRWNCGQWSDELGWLHIISDVAIFGAYLAIPIVLSYFILRRRDMPFPRIFWLFGAFILFCGSGHLIEAIIFWFPVYRLAGVVKFCTAIVSWVTVIAIVRILPEALRLPGIMKLNEQLKAEVEERRAIEAQLREQKAIAEKASQSKSEFLANMSHEIRTPLNGILGFTELLTDDKNLNHSHRKYIQTIASSGRHLLKLINDILDISKIEAGRAEFRKVRCSPLNVINDVESILRVRAAEKHLQLTSEPQGYLPESIETDPVRFRQLLMNLVGNAIKFTDQGRVRIVSYMSTQDEQNYLTVEVHDSGIGICDDSLTRIFRPFDQVDSSVTRRFGGTGLGLAISKHIAEGLGGDLSVQSKQGVGSIFTARIAVGSLEGQELISHGYSSTSLEPTDCDCNADLSGKSILLVEDGETNRELVSLFLMHAGAAVDTAENGAIGCDKAFQKDYDVILMDMQMPVMDGYTASEKLREAKITAPIVALTAHAMTGDADRCFATGCNAYLSKPVGRHELVQCVANLIRNNQTKRPPVSELPPIKQNRIESTLRSTIQLDDEAYERIVRGFVEKLRRRLEETKDALAVLDYSQVAEFAHWAKGTGGMVGFEEVTKTAMHLETSARNNDRSETQHAFREMEELAEQLVVPGET